MSSDNPVILINKSKHIKSVYTVPEKTLGTVVYDNDNLIWQSGFLNADGSITGGDPYYNTKISRFPLKKSVFLLFIFQKILVNIPFGDASVLCHHFHGFFS